MVGKSGLKQKALPINILQNPYIVYTSRYMKSHYNHLLTGIYQEVNALGNVPQNGWVRTVQPEYGITTWTLTEDRSLGRTGTNGQLQVKLFEPGAYDFVKTEDYLERGKLIYDAANRLIQFAQANNPDLLNQFNNWMTQAKSAFDNDIQQNANLSPAMVRLGETGYFDGKHQQATRAIRELLANVATAVQAANPDLDFNHAVNAICQSEKELLKERGRPNVVKIGALRTETNTQMVSAQFTKGDETIPSSLRAGNYDTKLSNHVQDCTAVLENDAVDVKVLIGGHSSYTPIADRTDMWSRVRTGTAALKEKIAASVGDMLAVNPEQGTKDNPVDYSLSSMMMLTPLGFKKLDDKLRGQESEAEQVREGRLVMEIIRHAGQPMEIMVNGNPVYVNVNLSYMNVPTNEISFTQMFKSSAIQEGMNAKGMIDYINLMQEDSKERMMQCLQQGSNTLKLALEACHGQIKLNSPELLREQAKLRNEYKNLAYYLEHPPTNNELKTTLANIDTLETSINKRHQAALNEYRERYQNPAVIAFAQGQLDKALANPNLTADLRDYLVMQKRSLQARDMFFNESYLKPENSYIFQALYLLSNAQKGRDIECFCKSGEDRTGWMRVTLLAMTDYNLTYGRDPDFNNKSDRDNYHRYYIEAAHDLSASLDNTFYNSAARGFQVAAKCTTTQMPMECDRAMATLAKPIFDDKAALKPTRSCAVINNRLVSMAGEAMDKSRSSSFSRIRLSGDKSFLKRFSLSKARQSAASSNDVTPEGSPFNMRKG